MPLSWSTIPHCQNRPSLSKGTRLTSQDTRPSPSFISRSWLWSWTGGNADLEQIVLRFSGRAAQLVRERNWHSSQQIQELAADLRILGSGSVNASHSPFLTTIGLKAHPEFVTCDFSFGHKIRLFSAIIMQVKRLRAYN